MKKLKIIDAVGLAFLAAGVVLGAPLVYAGVLLFKWNDVERR